MRKNIQTIIVAMLLMFCASVATLLNATNYYVTQNGAGNKDGSEWAHASDLLQDIIEESVAGDSIFVAEGTYTPYRYPVDPTTSPYWAGTAGTRSYTFLLKNGVAMFGGFPSLGGSMTARDPFTNETILSGDAGTPLTETDNLYHVLLLIGTQENTNTLLDGFIVERANADESSSNYQKQGGGIVISQPNNPHLYASLIIMRNMTFRNNRAYSQGAAIYSAGSRVIIENSSFNDNKSAEGAAIALVNSIGAYFNYFTIDGCEFINNEANRGAAIFASKYELKCTNTSFSNNKTIANNGGAIYSDINGDGSFFEFEECIFRDNTAAQSGGAISHHNSVNSSGKNLIKNCLFTGNQANGFSDGHGGAIYCRDASIDSILFTKFRENISQGNGGAITMYSTSGAAKNLSSYIKNTSFVKNKGQASGGAIYNNDYNVIRLYGCVIDSNSSNGFGGGINNTTNGEIYLERSTITNNEGTGGGGIRNDGKGKAFIFLTKLNKNKATNGSGGGINNYDGILECTDVNFESNEATMPGGGLCNEFWSKATLKRCNFLLNSAQLGGAIATRINSELLYYTGTVRGNYAFVDNAPEGGGGIFSYNSMYTATSRNSVTIVNVSITENYAASGSQFGSGRGGGIYTENSKLKLVNATIAGNYSSDNGGGISNATQSTEPDTIHIHNTVIYGNYSAYTGTSADEYENLFYTAFSPMPPKEHLITHSLIRYFTPGNNGNIQWNAGTTNTGFMSPVPDNSYHSDLKADYRIYRNSSLIGKGNNDTFYNAAKDIFGIPLPTFYEDASESPRFIDSIIDIGAFENIYVKPNGKIIYVDINVAPGGKCTGETWRDAIPKLGDALFGIKSLREIEPTIGVDSLWVAQGVYHPKYDAATTLFVNRDSRGNSFVLLDSLKIYGGFSPDYTYPPDDAGANEISDADPDLYKTILSGNIGDTLDSTDNALHVVIASGIEKTLLNGFYIEDGYAKDGIVAIINVNGNTINSDDGGGMYCYNTPEFIAERLRFNNNYANNNGGGLYNVSGIAVLESFNFNSNSAHYEGGAVYSSDEQLYSQNSNYISNSAGLGGAVYSKEKLYSNNSNYTGNTVTAQGGAVYAENGFSSEKDSFVDNASVRSSGGAVYVLDTLHAYYSVFLNNSSFGDGGAVYSLSDGTNPNSGINDLIKCSFIGNKAGNGGGALYVYSGPRVDIDSSLFKNNIAVSNDGGGALFVYVVDNWTVRNSEFLSNTSEGFGGAAHFYYGIKGIFLNNRVSGNKAKTQGGGIYVNLGDSNIFANSLFSGNQAPAGGGVYVTDGLMNFYTNITVSGNSLNLSSSTIQKSSGMFLGGGKHYIRNSIIWANHDTAQEQIVDSLGAIVEYNHSLVQKLYPSGTGNLDGTDPSNDPLFADIGPIGTVFEGGDYRVSITSPILNKGLNDHYNPGKQPDLSKDTFDLNGAPRILDGVVDMGAYEYNAKITLTLVDKTDTADGNPKYIDSVYLKSNGVDIVPNTKELINYYYYTSDWEPVNGLPDCPGVYNVVAISSEPYPDLSDTAILTIVKDSTPQSITFASIPIKLLNIDLNPFTLTGTSSTGYPVKFVVTGGNESCVTVTPEGVVTMLDTGTVYITAYQDSVCYYLTPDTVTQVLVITKYVQEIVFDTALEKYILLVNGVNLNPPDFDLTGAASSGLDVTYSIAGGMTSIIRLTPEGNVTMLDTGTVLIRAEQSGNDTFYAAEPVICRLHINPVYASLDSIINSTGEKLVFNPRDTLIHYVVPCEYTDSTIEFDFYTSNNAIIIAKDVHSYNPLVVDISTPGQQFFYFELFVSTPEGGDVSVNYTFIVEKHYAFNDIVITKWNNTFIANNKRAEEEFGLVPVNPAEPTNKYIYEWYKDGELISELSYYSAGDNSNDMLSATSEYYLILGTGDGREVRTCRYLPDNPLTHWEPTASSYPNPVSAGSTITIESNLYEMEPDATYIDVYNVQGAKVFTKDVGSYKTTIRMPSQKGLYIIAVRNASAKKQISVIVQ